MLKREDVNSLLNCFVTIYQDMYEEQFAGKIIEITENAVFVQSYNENTKAPLNLWFVPLNSISSILIDSEEIKKFRLEVCFNGNPE